MQKRFHDFLEKSNKIFRKISTSFSEIEENPTRFLNISQTNNVPQCFQNNHKVFIAFTKTQQGFHPFSKTHDKVNSRIPNMFSQILDFDKVIKTFIKYHKVFFKKIQQDFLQISSSKISKKKKKSF